MVAALFPCFIELSNSIRPLSLHLPPTWKSEIGILFEFVHSSQSFGFNTVFFAEALDVSKLVPRPANTTVILSGIAHIG